MPETSQWFKDEMERIKQSNIEFRKNLTVEVEGKPIGYRYRLNELCTMEYCAARQMWLDKPWDERKPRLYSELLPRDSDTFIYCAWCGRINRKQLIQCPDCNVYFKGPRPNFPISYECEKCG